MKITLHIRDLTIEVYETPDVVGLPEQVRTIAKLWADGKTCSEIAAAIGRGDATGLISSLRKNYPDLFPYREVRRNGAAK